MKCLITGIAGTWGRAFTELLKDQHEIIGVDNTEKLVAEFRHLYPQVSVHLLDFVDYEFEPLDIDLVIHLAAYKHIDLAETNVASCVDNNVTKTAIFFENAKISGADIMFVSTDKAVKPASVYGYTKALGEKLCEYHKGCLVRSGNIIGSNGSVIHIWRDAIKNNKPLSVTDLDMERYFIKVDDAVRLAWEGYTRGERKILVDLGGRLKLGQIIDNILAETGQSMDTYGPGVKVIGKRPGERLIDEIDWPAG